jgi:hypothetical protein
MLPLLLKAPSTPLMLPDRAQTQYATCTLQAKASQHQATQKETKHDIN